MSGKFGGNELGSVLTLALAGQSVNTALHSRFLHSTPPSVPAWRGCSCLVSPLSTPGCHLDFPSAQATPRTDWWRRESSQDAIWVRAWWKEGSCAVAGADKVFIILKIYSSSIKLYFTLEKSFGNISVLTDPTIAAVHNSQQKTT